MIPLRPHALLALACLPCIGGPAETTRAQPAAHADPVPLRRIVIPFDRVPAEAQRQGVLVQLPRAEFEAKVRAAALAKEAARIQPRLLKAVYTAEFSGQSLVGGSGQWSVQHAGAGSGILSLPQFNLAVSKIKVGNVDAVLGDLDGKNLGLWIEKPGDHAAYFDWTARGQAQLGGVSFEIRVPTCPVTILELRLPSNHAMTLATNAGMLTGPFDTETSGQKLWRIQATGRTHIGFTVRKNSVPANDALVFTATESRQALTTAFVRADFDVQVESNQNSLSELVFDHDAGLHPYEVTLRQAEIKDWATSAGPQGAKDKTASLSIRLREPRQGTLHARIRCLAAWSSNAPWTSPALKLRRAIPRGETLKLTVPPDRPVDRWDAGQFQLLTTNVDKDGVQTLHLVDLHPEAAAPRRPQWTLAPTTSELLVRQQSRWAITPEGMTLSTDLVCSVRRGRQFQLVVETPPGPWRVEQVVFEPKEAMRTWSMAHSRITIELQTALEPRSAGKVSIRMKAPLEHSNLGPHVAPIPDLKPIAAFWRQATLAVVVDPSLQATLASASTPTTLPDAGEDDASVPPSFFFKYGDPALVGALRLQSTYPTLKTRIQQTATLHRGQSFLDARIDVDPHSGQLAHLDLHFSTPLRGNWTVVDEGGVAAASLKPHFEPATAAALMLLGTHVGVDRWAAWAQLPRGETRRVRWDQPLTQRTSLALRGPLNPLGGAEPLPPFGIWPGPRPLVAGFPEWHLQRWDIPIITAARSESEESELVVKAAGVVLAHSDPAGLKPLGPDDGSTERVYRWQGAVWSPALTLWTKPSVEADHVPALFDHAQLLSFVQKDARCLHHYRFQAVQWSKAELPVRLPLSAGRFLAGRLDGLWLDRWQQQSDADGIEIRLPMPLDGKSHWFDMVFVSEATPSLGPCLFTTTTPYPQLPTAPLRQRHTWRLAPGLAPLHQESLRSLHQATDSAAAKLRRFWQSADAIFPHTMDDWLEPQRQVLMGADTALRRKSMPGGALGEYISRLLFDGLKEQTVLLLDRSALREAGLTPEASGSPGLAGANVAPSWELFGLVYVPNPVAPLLTTKQRWLDWRQGQNLPEGLHDALAKATAFGQDPLGDFCRADLWLRTEAPARLERAPGPAPNGDWQVLGWTEWTSDGASHESHAALVVVDLAAVRVVGLAGAFLLGVALLATRRRWSSANRLRLTILLLSCNLLSMIALPRSLTELPFWSALVLSASLVLEYLAMAAAARSGSRTAPSSERRRASVAAGYVALALLSSGWLAWAQPEQLETVLVVETGPEQTSAFVRPELLQRLEQLRQRAAQPAQGAVLVGASYSGKSLDAVSAMHAQFDLYCFSENAQLQVPLGGVELQEGAFLDGAPVFPTAAAGKPGYVVPIQGKGWHRLMLSFAVRHQTIGDFQEVRWTTPSLAQSQIVWQAAASLGSVLAPRAVGETKATLDAGKKMQEIRVSQGRESQVQLRWRSAVVTGLGDPKVREHYFWNFEPRSPSLEAVLEYLPTGGNLSRVEIALPDGVEVCEAHVSGNGTESTAVTWHVLRTSGPRRLAVELSAPAPAPFRVHLQLALRGGLLQSNLNLQLPTPLGAMPVEGVLAYWVDHQETTDKARNLGVTRLAPEAFAAAWANIGKNETISPTRAYSFRRAAANAGLEVTLPATLPKVKLETDWLVQPGGASLRLQAGWSHTREMPFVELAAPPNLKIIDLAGPNLHHWTIHEQKVRAWLEKPSQQAALTLHASMPSAAETRTFDVPRVQFLPAQVDTNLVSIQPAFGWTMTPERLSHLQPAGADRERRFQATNQDYEGVFTLRQTATPPEFHALTTVEQRGSAAYVTVALVGWLAQGDYPALTVRLGRWTGATPHIEASTPVVKQSYAQTGALHTWTLQFAPGSARVAIIKIHGAAPAGKNVVLPRIELDGGNLADQHATWSAAEWSVVNMQGLKELTANAATRPRFLAALPARRSTSLWIADRGQWHCELAAPNPEDARPGRVLYAEQQAQPAGAGRWLHQADWLLLTRDLRELRLALPADAVPVIAQVNGHNVDARGLAPNMVALPLPERSGLFQVRLTWRYDPALEASERPRLATPLLPDADGANVYGVVFVPAGAAPLEPPAGFKAGELPQLQALARAAALAEKYNAAEAPDDRSSARAAWKRQFETTARHLEYQALLLSSEAALDALAMLRKEHLALTKPALVVPAKTRLPTDLIWSVAKPDAGVPYYWVNTAGDLHLSAQSSPSFAPSWARESIVICALAVLLLSWLPGGVYWLARLWPEQLAGMAALGFTLWGGSVMAGLLVTAAATGRLLMLAGWLRRGAGISQRPATAAPSN